MTRPAAFKQADLTRALKAAANGGVRVAKIELEPNGKIVIFTGRDHTVSAPNEWDEELR